MENCARLQRRGVPNHRLGSLKIEPNDTQAKRREHPKQRASGQKSCQRGNSATRKLPAPHRLQRCSRWPVTPLRL